MANWNQIKQDYLTSKQDAWSYSTYKGEASRLANISEDYLPSNPAGLYAALLAADYAAYTAKTTMIRAGELVDFAIRTGKIKPQVNQFKLFMKQKARLFKHNYVPKRPKTTFDAARAALLALPSSLERDFALGLLASGLRISEAFSVRDGQVIGKGGLPRQVYNAPEAAGVSAHKLRALLTKLSLTPHMLRKLAATKAVELGAREAELLSIFGWTNAQTASYYVQAQNNAAIAAKLKEQANG